jgi:phosphoribosylformylglycinamidine (FGAM) synthase-like amidotransferase family enzyme
LRKTAYDRAKSAFGEARGREGDANPNGSVNNIAGIYSKDLNVLGGQT